MSSYDINLKTIGFVPSQHPGSAQELVGDQWSSQFAQLEPKSGGIHPEDELATVAAAAIYCCYLFIFVWLTSKLIFLVFVAFWTLTDFEIFLDVLFLVGV